MPISGTYPGKTLRVKVEDDPGPGFSTIAFAQTDTLRINNTEVEALTKDSGSWRDVFPDGSITSLTVESTWVFDNTTDQIRMRDLAARNATGATPKANFEILDGSGEAFKGEFQVTNYEATGGAEGFIEASVTLTSNGAITIGAPT